MHYGLMGRVATLALAFGFLIPQCSSRAEESTKRVLLLFSYNIAYPGVMSIGQGAIRQLRDKSPEKLELLSEFLDLARFSDPSDESRTARYLASKYADRIPDVVITAGREASQFILKHRAEIAPDVPIVACCLTADTFAAVTGSTKITGVISGRDISRTLDLAQRLQPSARNLVIIAGAAEFDRQWVQIARQQIETRALHYETRYLVGYPYDALVKEVSQFPPNTIAVALTYFADNLGERYVSPEVVGKIANAASAPVYSPYPTAFGSGIVGGYSDFNESMGAQTADLALEILAGKDANTIAPQLSTGGTYRVDDRQLKRWHLSDANVPASTVVSFKRPTLWDQHRALISSVIGLVALQTAIIVYVLLQNRRRRRAESALAESQERMAFTAASTNTGLWQFQDEDTPIWAAEHSRSILGVAENMPLSLETLRDAVHPDDRRALVRSIRDAASSGRPIDSEFRVVCSDDETRWIAMKGYPRRDQNNGPYFVNGVFSDITALRNAEHETELQRIETARLMRQSLLGELSGTIAHELNQPLTAILFNAETAQDLLGQKNIDVGKIQEIVADIIEEDSRAGEVISRVRKLLRKGESKLELINLNQLVESTLHLLHGEFLKRKVQIEVSLVKNLPMIYGDPIQLQQVLLNLIMNAMEAMSATAPSQRSINITTRANDGKIEIAVVDFGPGFAADDKARLFQPFFTTKEHGLGLGLSICSTIVKAHGGNLSIEGNAGGGATALVAQPIQNMPVAA